jgi:hypothetical protein
MTTTDYVATSDDTALRERAKKRLKKRRDFHAHLLVFTLVNSVTVLIWLLTNPGGFFWPVFPIAFWGIGLVMNAWDVYRGDEFSDEQIAREVAKLR